MVVFIVSKETRAARKEMAIGVFLERMYVERIILSRSDANN